MFVHPAQAVTLLDSVKAQVQGVIDYYKSASRDGMTPAEWVELLSSAVASFMRLFEQLTPASGDDKKAAVLYAVELLYDQVIAPINISYVPDVIEKTLVDPILKQVVLHLASGLIDSFANIFNRTGWFDVPPGTNGGKTQPAQPTPAPVPAPPMPPQLPPGFVPY